MKITLEDLVGRYHAEFMELLPYEEASHSGLVQLYATGCGRYCTRRFGQGSLRGMWRSGRGCQPIMRTLRDNVTR